MLTRGLVLTTPPATSSALSADAALVSGGASVRTELGTGDGVGLATLVTVGAGEEAADKSGSSENFMGESLAMLVASQMAAPKAAKTAPARWQTHIDIFSLLMLKHNAKPSLPRGDRLAEKELN